MKTNFKNKKAFTLIELLIVIAIIGILFIVLVSKVDFATDKAKATGVQTDFRSFQVALDTVAKENAGFNTFGYNTGDNAGAIPDGYAFESTEAENKTKGDGIRNSYDQGDKNLNGKQDTGEVFTGRKIYTETWTEVYTLTKPGTTGLDATAVFALESAINANLDPKLHITINAADGKITMANQARDPWKNEYHGVYISQAERDNGADRGAIIIYSNGANGKWGSAHDITNGVVTVTVPGNNVNGKDDYSFVSCYTFVNGYGEVLNMSTGFSNNQGFLANNSNNSSVIVPGDQVGEEVTPDDSGNVNINYEMTTGDIVVTEVRSLVFRSLADVSTFKEFRVNNQVVPSSYYTVTSGSTVVTLSASYVELLPDGIYTVEIISTDGKAECELIKDIKVEIAQPGLYDTNDNLIMTWQELIDNGFKPEIDHGTEYGDLWIQDSGQLGYVLERAGLINSNVKLILHDDVTRLGCFVLYGTNVISLTVGQNFQEFYKPVNWMPVLQELIVAENNQYMYSQNNTIISADGKTVILGCSTSIIPDGVIEISTEAFMHSGIQTVVIPNSVIRIGLEAFGYCYNLKNVQLSSNLQYIETWAFTNTDINSICIPSSVQSIGDYAFSGCDRLNEVYNNSTLNIIAGSDTHGGVAKYASIVINSQE